METYWIRYKSNDGKTYQCAIHADTKDEAETLFERRNPHAISYEFID